MKLICSITEGVLRKVRKVAQSMGLSLNEAVRRFLDRPAGGHSAEDDIREIDELSAQSEGRSHGWRFNREEIHHRT